MDLERLERRRSCPLARVRWLATLLWSAAAMGLGAAQESPPSGIPPPVQTPPTQPPPAIPPTVPPAVPPAEQEGAKPASKPEEKKPQIDWIASWPEALRRSRSEKKPLFVAFNQDGEVASDALVKLYHDEKLVEKSRFFICVVCSVAKHTEWANESGLATCERFGAIACADHLGCETLASSELIGTNLVLTPQHVISTGEGRVLARRAFQLTLPELLKLMDGALRLAGAPGAPASGDPKVDAARAAELLHESEKAGPWRKDEHIKALAEIGSEVAHNALLDYMAKKTGDDETRTAIIERLAVSGDYLMLEPLRKLTKEGKSHVALSAVDGLGKLRLPDAIEDLKKLINVFSAGNDQGRVIRALAACGRTDKGVRDIVLKRARTTDQNVRAHSLVALGLLESCPEIDELLKRALDDKVTNARACSAYAVGKGRHVECKAALEKLAATETNVDLKDLAESALAHLGHDPADLSCCNLENKVDNFIELGDGRRRGGK